MSDGCCLCGRDANLRVRQAGEEQRYCVSCLDASLPHFSLGSVAQSFLSAPSKDGECPHCGWTDERAKSSGYVGCPLCYESLSSEVWNAFHLAAAP